MQPDPVQRTLIRDGIDAPVSPRVLHDRGWRPISTAPLACVDLVSRPPNFTFSCAPFWIEGLTTHGNVVVARYLATGDFNDRWSNGNGNIIYRLTHWRPLKRISP